MCTVFTLLGSKSIEGQNKHVIFNDNVIIQQ